MLKAQRAGSKYHEAADSALINQHLIPLHLTSGYTFNFENFFHPLVGRLIKQLNATSSGDGIAQMLKPEFLNEISSTFFSSQYKVDTADASVTSYPAKIDLDLQQPYANYNWELLYHIPVAIAVHLSRSQHFAEAQKWFHYVFDPTAPGPAAAPGRFWKFLYFQNSPQSVDLVELLTSLSNNELTPAQVQSLHDIYTASISTPFDPFVVARSRPIAFQYYVVMQYLNNLIAWGDSLFTQMTIETVNEATLCYVLAANLLGPAPQPVPQVGASSALSYNEIAKIGVDLLGDALVQLEAEFPFNVTTTSDSEGTGQNGSVFGMGQSLYFCVPANDQLLGYWDTVADRLTKIRNCENIEGQVQLMPLFDPPIDPGMLVAAAAAGLDIGSVVSGLNQPSSPVRSPQVLQKALELCQEVRSLGGGLLSALEKQDSEALARLRQNNEVALQQATQGLRFLQWQQAQASTEALLRSRASAVERYSFYLRELGLTPDATAVPPAFTVDHTTVLTEDNFADAYQSLVARYDLTVPIQPYAAYQPVQSNSPSAQSGASGTGNLYLNANEDVDLNTHMPTSRDEHLAASVIDTVAAVLAPIPDVNGDLHYWGLGVHSKVFGGGQMLARVATLGGDVLRILAAWQDAQGAIAAKTAGYQRRADDWLLQANLAAHELAQLGRQILTSILAEQAAQAEYTTAQLQIGQSQDVLNFMQSKFTNTELYGWMQGQLSALYYQYYRLALDTARKAEATVKWELMRPEVSGTAYIQPNYWDSGHQGLLAGEALYRDLKTLDLDYQSYNQRELELTRHVSLRQLNPMALLQLKITGSTTVTIPEWLYDRDCPGHYMRRVKSVAVTVPAVVGPYTSVNCTLALQSSSVRISSDLTGGQYARSSTSDDARFVDYYGSVDEVVTSAAVSDSGMFETNLRDERFLPFEGAGAISTWTLSLPPLASFDYSTITDVILHVRYTARDGGAALAAAATKGLGVLPPVPGSATGGTPTLALLLSLRHDFPTEWYAFTTGGTNPFSAALTTDFFPYIVQNATLAIEAISIYAAENGEVLPAPAIAVPPTMASELKATGSTTLDLPQDPNVLNSNGSATKDVYVIISYTAKISAG